MDKFEKMVEDWIANEFKPPHLLIVDEVLDRLPDLLLRVAEQQKEKDAKIAEDYSAEFNESASPYVVGLGVAAAIREKGNR